MEKTLAVADCETNPFDKGCQVYPFVWGFYDGSSYHEFWDCWKTGKSCTQQFLEFLEALPNPHMIFAHNGGKFDWLFFIQKLRGDLRIIGSRIVKAQYGVHELRDSFANLPVPLKDFGNKLEFDYSLCKPEQRKLKKNQRIITEYLKQDCVGLYHALVKYRAMFGDTLTMASAAMQQLNLVCTGEKSAKIYERLTPKQDAEFRPFYFGGRVECLRRGILHGSWKVYDVTSMYPYCMREYAHPISNGFSVRIGAHAKITEETDFLCINATIRGTIGALPLRCPRTGGLTFPVGRHTFFATGAEVRRALELDILKVHEIHRTISAHERICFRSFVDQFFTLRNQAKTVGDVMLTLFYKLVLNSAYGKLAIDPTKYEDMVILPDTERPDGDTAYDDEILTLPAHAQQDVSPCLCETCHRKKMAWRRDTFLPGAVVWVRPIVHSDKSFANVAAGASITGHARATLLHGLCNAVNPIYCDTDAIMCEDLQDVPFAKTKPAELGSWALEARGHTAAVAGKKMYALFGDRSTDEKENTKRQKNYGDETCVKLASKGVRLKAGEISAVASGLVIKHTQEAPMFKLNGNQTPLTREIRMTH